MKKPRSGTQKYQKVLKVAKNSNLRRRKGSSRKNKALTQVANAIKMNCNLNSVIEKKEFFSSTN